MLLVNIANSILPDKMMDDFNEVRQELEDSIRSSEGDPVRNRYMIVQKNLLEVSKKCRDFISHVKEHEKESISTSESTSIADRAHELDTELQNSIEELEQAYQTLKEMKENTRGTTEKESEP